jgi:hypothetical protein
LLPSLNVTVPVGVVVGDVTVAVKVTVCPLNEGFSDDFTVVALVACLTVCRRAAEVLFAVSESPLYVAVMESVPVARLLLVSVATPLVFAVAEPTEVVPFLKTTVPVGDDGAVDVTVALSVTD